MCFTMIPHIICCLVSSYSYLFCKIDFFKNFGEIYKFFFASPIMSFPVSLAYIALGKYMSERKNEQFDKKDIFALLASLVLLYVEWRVSSHYSGTTTSDCLFMLFPCVLYIFKNLFHIKIHIKGSKTIRAMSTIIYPLHMSVAIVVRGVMRRFALSPEMAYGMVAYFSTVCICLIVCYVIFKLEKKGVIKILRYAH